MKNVAFFVLLFTSASNLVAQSEPVLKSQVYSPTQLKEDITLLKTVLAEVHPALYAYTEKRTIDSLFRSVEKRISVPFSDIELYRALAPVVSRIRCGHTRLSPPLSAINHIRQGGKIAPFDIRILSGKLIICQNYGTDSTLTRGAELLSLNCRSAAEVLRQILPLTFSDGYADNLRYRTIEREFFLFYFLAFGDTETFDLEILDLHNQKRQLKCEASSLLSRQRSRRPLTELSELRRNAAIVLTIRSFNTDRYKQSGQDYFQLMDSLFNRIRQLQVRHLIIDVRGNDGGDPQYVSYLYGKIAKGDFTMLNYPEFITDKRLDYFGDTANPDFYRFKKNSSGYYVWQDTVNPWYGTCRPAADNYRGRASLLMDGGSFSSSGFLGALFRYDKRGLLIGEASGGGGSCNDCHGILTLPNSGLRAEIARCHVTLNGKDSIGKGRGILPDHAIEQSREDLIQGKDTALEFALKLAE